MAWCGVLLFQVDDLKKENQKLLQIIAQLQAASIGSFSGGAAPPGPLQGPAAGSTLLPLGRDGEAECLPAGTASCLSAGAPHDSIDSGPSGAAAGGGAAGQGTAGGVLGAGMGAMQTCLAAVLGMDEASSVALACLCCWCEAPPPLPP